ARRMLIVRHIHVPPPQRQSRSRPASGASAALMSQAFEARPGRRPALWWGILLAVLALVFIGIDYGVWTFFFELRHDIVRTDNDALYNQVVAAGSRIQALATVAQIAAVSALAIAALLYLL